MSRPHPQNQGQGQQQPQQSTDYELEKPAGRLPPVPPAEAHINMLRDDLNRTGASGGTQPSAPAPSASAPSASAPSAPSASASAPSAPSASAPSAPAPSASAPPASASPPQKYRLPFMHRSGLKTTKTAKTTSPPSHTNPLFPPLPLYGPPSILRSIQSTTFRVSSFVLSLSFLGVVVLGSLFTSIPGAFRRTAQRLTFRDPDAHRPFLAEEQRRSEVRRQLEDAWRTRRLAEDRIARQGLGSAPVVSAPSAPSAPPAPLGDTPSNTYTPTEGGPDPLVPDVGYYARRVGLDVESFEVQTEDGFILDLWHVFDPKEHVARPPDARKHHGPGLLFDETTADEREAIQQQMLAEHSARGTTPKYPVLLVHGLLQSAGAYCVNDDDSLAFFLCKSGYDVWLGNNRCGFHPRHAVLKPSDPRMWCWNIRQMGVFDLPALTSRVLRETRFARLGLVCHSQGTTEAFVALAKEQRPELGRALSVFCALAPAAYAGRLVEKMYFRFMRILSPSMFRLVFGIHAFIPLMMQVHPLLPGRLYGWMGYRVFSFLFEWSDARWDRGLRDRMFQFAPVYVSAESMRWWLGREGFARHKCILSTKDEWRAEEREDDEAGSLAPSSTAPSSPRRKPPGATAWYDERVPPFALWVCGRDDLVDGRRLLKRLLPHPVFHALYRGDANDTSDTRSRIASSGDQKSYREPHVRVVHAKLIPEYEHLDVLWAMDAVDQVHTELRAVLWKTCPVRAGVRVPVGCDDVAPWHDPSGHDTRTLASASSSERSDTDADDDPSEKDRHSESV